MRVICPSFIIIFFSSLFLANHEQNKKTRYKRKIVKTGWIEEALLEAMEIKEPQMNVNIFFTRIMQSL